MANLTTGTYEVDPISRIEGHLGVKVELGATGIIEANAHGNLWRGFENFLVGRDSNDPITVTQRICGVCPVPHGLTATYAADAALNVTDGYISFADTTPGLTGRGVPPKAVLIRNLVLGAEYLMSSITHFYHLAALSYVQGPPIPPWTPCYPDTQYSAYLIRKGHGATAAGGAAGATDDGVLPLNDAGRKSKDLWSAVIKQYLKALRVRRLTFEAGALFAGRMPMTSCFVAGGVTNFFRDAADFDNRCDKFRALIAEVGNFVVEEYVPLVLALGALYPGFDNTANGGQGYGAGLGNFLSWGAFPDADATGALALDGGIWTGGVAGGLMSAANGGLVMTQKSDVAAAKTAVQDHLVEVITRSRYANSNGYSANVDYAFPGAVKRTEPKRDDEDKYSWMKAPRWRVAKTNSTGVTFAAGSATASATLDAADGRNIGLVGYTAGVHFTVAKAAGSGAWTVTRVVDTSKPSGFAVADGACGVTYDVFHALEVGPLARLVVDGKYPLGARLASNAEYARIYAATATTLDTTVISADLVNALSNPAENLLATVQTFILGDGSTTGMKCGLSTMDRLRARALESVWMTTFMVGAYDKTLVGGRAKGFPKLTTDASAGGWVAALKALGHSAASYKPVAVPTTEITGFGCVEAPRGALAHFNTSKSGKVVRYQCVVPTTWNGSPKDGEDADGAQSLRALANIAPTKRGAIEQAMIGAPFDDAKTNNRMSGVEVLRIAQSFDPCIACAVH